MIGQLLRQSTVATVVIGPAVDIVDNVTPETAMEVSGINEVDEVGVYKHDGTALVDLKSFTTLAHRAGGMYTVTLRVEETDTLGRLTLFMRYDNVCLPVSKDFMVVPAEIYDLFIAGTEKIALRK